jgi:hypothetical protein
MPDKHRFLLRLEPAVYDALQRWADAEMRSVNGQIELVLRRAVHDAGLLRGGEVETTSAAADQERSSDEVAAP